MWIFKGGGEGRMTLVSGFLDQSGFRIRIFKDGGEEQDDNVKVVSGFWVKVDVGCGFSRKAEILIEVLSAIFSEMDIARMKLWLE